MSVHTTPDSYTKLLIHSDTSDGSTTFVDSSTSSHTINVTSATHENTQKKFGSTSMYFGGGVKYIIVPHHADFDFDSEFTIDFWAWQSAYGSQANNRFMQKGANQTDGWGIMTENGSHDVYFGRTDEELAKFTQDLRDSTWHHIAVTRQSDNKFRIYLDGVLKDTSSVYADNLNDGGDLEIAKYPGGTNDRYAGYMDEIRISKGIVRWTDSFVPPSKPYSVMDDDLVTDVAGIEDESSVTTVGKDFVVKSDPGEATTDSVFSVSAKDGTVLMDIRADGVVSKPLTPSFRASTTSNPSNDTTIVWNSVHHNAGSHYNNSNGRFTAPVDGNYMFMVKTNVIGRIDYYIQVNGTHTLGGQWDTSSAVNNGWFSQQLSCILQLSAADYVSVKVTPMSVSWDNSYWNSFSGCLVG